MELIYRELTRTPTFTPGAKVRIQDKTINLDLTGKVTRLECDDHAGWIIAIKIDPIDRTDGAHYESGSSSGGRD